MLAKGGVPREMPAYHAKEPSGYICANFTVEWRIEPCRVSLPVPGSPGGFLLELDVLLVTSRPECLVVEGGLRVEDLPTGGQVRDTSTYHFGKLLFDVSRMVGEVVDVERRGIVLPESGQVEG